VDLTLSELVYLSQLVDLSLWNRGPGNIALWW